VTALSDMEQADRARRDVVALLRDLPGFAGAGLIPAADGWAVEVHIDPYWLGRVTVPRRVDGVAVIEVAAEHYDAL